MKIAGEDQWHSLKEHFPKLFWFSSGSHLSLWSTSLFFSFFYTYLLEWIFGCFKDLKDFLKCAVCRTKPDIFLAPGDKDGSVVMGVVAIIQHVLALLPDAEILQSCLCIEWNDRTLLKNENKFKKITILKADPANKYVYICNHYYLLVVYNH